MKKILIIKGEKAYLPEAYAYKEFFEKNGFEVRISNICRKDERKWADIIWKIMGTDFKSLKKDKKIIIHDYRSLTESKIKDFIKRKINKKPTLRIYLNKTVKEGMRFNDNIPSVMIDMGISEQFKAENKKTLKKYKFVYSGAISEFREVDKILEWFVMSEFKNEKFLLIGSPENVIYEKYKNNPSIEFIGKVDYNEVPKYLRQAEYAFCHIPNMYPYNSQTPTKLLEYIALDLKILSNKTYWIHNFLEKNNKEKLFLYNNFSEITETKIEKFRFKNIDMTRFYWNNLLELSGISKFLKGDE